MTSTSDLVKHLVDQKPSEFAAAFDELVRDRLSQVVADKKVELSSTLFGAPEAVDSELEQQEPEENDGEKTETSDDQ